MKNLKVCIDNPSSTSITIKGRNGIKIPAHATGDAAVTLDLPDTPQIAKTLSRLRREYPALHITLEKLAGSDASMPGDEEKLADSEDSTPGDQDVQDKKAENTQAASSGQDNTAHTRPLSKDEFAAMVANTAEKGSGWWDVTVDGLTEPFKVRGAKDENSAVELAYEAYLEDLTSPAGE